MKIASKFYRVYAIKNQKQLNNVALWEDQAVSQPASQPDSHSKFNCSSYNYCN